VRILTAFSLVLLAAINATAAPNVTNAMQKGSVLVFPDVRVDGDWNTLVRLQNDGSQDVDVRCLWVDGNRNRVAFTVAVTRDQPVWFDARTGHGPAQFNRFPQSRANGFDNPFLVGKTEFPDEDGTTDAGPYLEGLLACWAIQTHHFDPTYGWHFSESQAKWNHLSGTATVYHPIAGAYEYNAYAFFAPTGLDQEPVGISGTLNLNGMEYDSCPQYLIGQLPTSVQNPFAPTLTSRRLVVAACSMNLNQDWQPVWTKLQFTVWNEDEVPLSGAYECSESWHETEFDTALTPTNGGPFDAGGLNFTAANLGTYATKYRVQGTKSTQCDSPGRVTQGVGLLGVQSTFLPDGRAVGTTLHGAGRFTGKIVWDPTHGDPEGGIR
jgi:hypothetical protein